MKKIANFHTHTQLCHHAKGMPADYAEQAEREGCTALGFSDHCPYPDEFFDTWPNIRMSVSDAGEYMAAIQEVKENTTIPVYQGFECEWEREFDGWYDELKSTYGAEYLVLGSHWVTDGGSHIYIPKTDSPSLLNKYIDQTIDGMRSGHFAFVAHPDIFMMACNEWDEQTKACTQAILDAAADLDLPIEINGLGTTKTPADTRRGMRHPYPYVEFWEMAAMTNVRVVCNSDAHNPEDLILNAWRARDFASRFGIEPLDSIFE